MNSFASSEISESEETDTDLNTLSSDTTDAEEVNNNAVSTLPSHRRTFRSERNSDLDGRREANVTVRSSPVLRTPSSPQPTSSTLVPSFHFSIGAVTFGWFLYYLWSSRSSGQEGIPSFLSSLPWYTSVSLVTFISVIAIAVTTAISIGVLKVAKIEPPKLYRLETYPTQFTSSDPAQRDLTHAEIVKQFRHNAMRPQTPYNHIVDTADEVDPRDYYKNSESGVNFLDDYYLRRIRKFKRALEEQQEVLERIRQEHESFGSQKNSPHYILCSPCYDNYNCDKIHFDYNGYLYHCQPYQADLGKKREKMDEVKIYKDNVLGQPSRKEDMSAPNDFPGRNLQSLIANKFPPFSHDFEISNKYKVKRQVRLVPPTPFTRLCPRQDPCIYCREHSSIHKNDRPHCEKEDCNGNSVNIDDRCESNSYISGGKTKTVGVGPNVLYMNYNFDYKK